jgi:predicted nucleic acid-binding protein
MSGYVVDASIAVKWLVTENFSEQAVRLLDEELTLIAPELLFAEAGNALWVMCRRGIITKADFAEAVSVLRAAPVSVPVSMRHLATSAGRLATDLDHPVYDCFYLALAVAWRAYFRADHTRMTIIPMNTTTAADKATTPHQPAALHNAPAATPPTLPPT